MISLFLEQWIESSQKIFLFLPRLIGPSWCCAFSFFCWGPQPQTERGSITASCQLDAVLLWTEATMASIHPLLFPFFFSHPLRLSSYFVLRASSSSCSDSVCLSLSASVPSHFVSLLPLCLSLSLSYFWFLVCPPSLFNILSLSPSPGCLARLCSSRRFSRFAVDKRGLTKIRMIELLKQNYLTQTRNLLSLLYVCWDRKKDNFMHLISKITSIIIWIQTCVLSVYWIVG